MLARYAISVVAGSVIAMGIVFAMQALIATASSALDETGARHFVDFVRVERDETLETKERKVERPVRSRTPPPAAPAPRTDALDVASTAMAVAPVAIEADLEIGGLGLEASDGDYLPIVKIAPVYPWKAQTQGIEGYCIVEYTVTESGTVRDVVVVEADPKSVFDKASIEAASKFKYRPRVVDGNPIAVSGVRNMFRYSLQG